MIIIYMIYVQVDDAVWKLVSHAIAELPQRPVMGIAADHQQLQPIKTRGESMLQKVCKTLEENGSCIELKEIHRTKDPKLTAYLNYIRFERPSRAYLEEYWGAKIINGGSLRVAVWAGMQIQESIGKLFTWLCVHNEGVSAVNEAGFSIWEESNKVDEVPHFRFRIDPKYGQGDMIIAPGITIRLTRNLDKPRGFVNGAVGIIRDVFVDSSSFTVRLSTGIMVLVHPITEKCKYTSGYEEDAPKYFSFLPATYGYATSIRRAQGASLDAGIIYFDRIRYAHNNKNENNVSVKITYIYIYIHMCMYMYIYIYM